MQPSESAAEALPPVAPSSEQQEAAPSDAAPATSDAQDFAHLQPTRPQGGIPQPLESSGGLPATAVAPQETEAYGGTHAGGALPPELATSHGGPDATAAAAPPAVEAPEAAYVRAGLPPESVASDTGTLSTFPDSLLATGDEDFDIPDSAAEAYRSTAEPSRPGAHHAQGNTWYRV